MPSDITVVVPTSPIKSHPSTDILEETIDSVRFHHPDAEIMLTFDGIHPKQSRKKMDYQEYVRRALWKADKQWGNVCPTVHWEHQHQANMMRAALDEINTPMVLYVEHDTPLVTDEPIDWGRATAAIGSGLSNSVRFHHEGVIPKEHVAMMHGIDKSGFLRTSQWSQRPHLASTAFYRRIIDDHFPVDHKDFIEDVMFGVEINAVNRDGIMAWHQFKTHIYLPEQESDRGNLKRSYHSDGRAGEQKYT